MTNTKGVTPLPDYRFSSTGVDILSISVRLPAIAERFGLTVQTWEDELGPTCAAFVRLPSGTAVVILELEHAIKHLGQKGPTFIVDAGYVVAAGIETIVSEILESFDLAKDAITWMAEREAAEEFARRAISHMQKRQP